MRKARLGIFLVDAGNDPALERQGVGQLIARRVDKIIISPVHMTRSRATVDYARSTLPWSRLTAMPHSKLIGS